MPRPGLPPTPASSTDLVAKETIQHAIEYGFSLGPPAIYSTESSASSNVSVKSDSSYRPISSPSSRKRPRQENDPGTQQETITNDYSLPPPPTRLRRIIQMKPDGVSKAKQMIAEETDKKKATANKKNATTTAAGKKTARKTAHSIIERRRRSKMNEEFETLKSMIPACNGQQMHKLAILQAGIDYMRYLEQCVTDLQGVSREMPPPPSITQSQAPTPRPQSVESLESDEEDEVDVEMDDTAADVSRAEEQELRVRSIGHFSAVASPIHQPQLSKACQYTVSNQSSTVPSPAFGPRNDSWSSIDRTRIPYTLSANTSPSMLPQIALDTEEASAALLMLNNDRRYSRSDRPTGLSVKDLLSH